MEILHEIFPLHPLTAAVAYFSREELDNPLEWRHCQQRTNPTIIKYPELIWWDCVSHVRNK